jgi:hypothetical protein
VAIDADYEDAIMDLLKLSFHLRQDGVESALEKSRRGGHSWIFMAEPLPARDCRIYVRGLALPLGIHRGAAQRFWFDGADGDLEKQMYYLNSLPKMTRDQLGRLIAGKAIPPQLRPPEPKAELEIRRHSGGPAYLVVLGMGLGWHINCCWIPREQNEECDGLSKKTADKPDSIHSLQVPA